jgi:galactose mutarotase-like enzyme
MKTTITRERIDGWDRVSLVNDRVTLQIFPELGGRVTSLFDRRSNREWLWAPPTGQQLFRNRTGDSFASGTHVGLDECIPTVAPCCWKGRELPDHGEIWALPWAVDVAALVDGVLSMTVDLPITPLRFARSIRLEGNCVRFDYRLQNLGAQPEDYLWAMHPLFTIQAGDALELPSDVTSLKLECATGVTTDGCGAKWSWPEPFAGVRLDRLELPDNSEGYLKAFAMPQVGEVRLRTANTGCDLSIRWDVATTPCLGLWLTRGGYRGWHHLAVEPSNGAPDSLETAVNDWRRSGKLNPGEERTWWVEWSLADAKR